MGERLKSFLKNWPTKQNGISSIDFLSEELTLDKNNNHVGRLSGLDFVPFEDNSFESYIPQGEIF